MSWPRRIATLLLALVGSGCCLCATLRADGELDDLSDASLPTLVADDDEMVLPPAEELPPVRPNTYAPRIDPDVVEELPPALQIAPSRNEFRDIDEQTVSEGALGDDASEPDDVQIVPQETIRERYENGRVKIERGVAQDDRENYVNHGPWRMWDEAGNLVAEGVFRYGKRHGKWVRWYQSGEDELFSVAPLNLFTGPFL